jgi:peroxiredoxin
MGDWRCKRWKNKGMMQRIGIIFGIILCFWLTVIPLALADIQTIILDNADELEIQIYPATGNQRLVWFPSSQGVTPELKTLAQKLNTLGVEVWIPDPFRSWFLPQASESMRQINVAHYVKVLDKASSDKPLFVATNDNAALLTLKATRRWQELQHQTPAGVILISPLLYDDVPEPGKDATFAPIAQASNLPIYLVMPRYSALFPRLRSSMDALQTGGSDVITHIIPDVRDRFFLRSDPTDAEAQQASRLPAIINSAMRLLKPYTAQARTAPKLSTPSSFAKTQTETLKALTTPWQAPTLSLTDIDGTPHKLTDYRGQVVLVNFWASWCPPCVHEIPSMNQAQQQHQNFTILAVNMAEPLADIKKFTARFLTAFTILSDRDQITAQDWRVFNFPTSYLVDKRGIIRYAVSGALDWNDQHAQSIIAELIQETR